MSKRRRHEWYRIQNAASTDEATIYIYDVIDSWYGVNANDLVRELAGITASKIHVRINSPGGSVFDGMAIYNALKRHKAEIITHVDGWAASAASFIALAGDTVLMGEGSFIMIHNAWGVAIGDAEDMRRMAETLDTISDAIIGIYERQTENDRDQIIEWMDAETWFNADAAIEAGFADAMEEGITAEASAVDSALVEHFKNVPREIAAVATERRSSEPAKKTERSAERALRDAGFSHAEAKAIVARGYKAAPEPRDEDGELAEIKSALQERGASLTLAR